MRVGHRLQLGRGLVALLVIVEQGPPALEPGLPETIRAGLLGNFLLLGDDLLVAHPAAVVLDVPEVPPRRVTIRIEHDGLREVRDRFRLEPVLFAPDAEPGVGCRHLRRGITNGPVIMNSGPEGHRGLLEELELVAPPVVLPELLVHELIGLEPGTDALWRLPFPTVGQEPHQSSGHRVPRVSQHGKRQVLHFFRIQPVLFAPECQTQLRGGVASSRGLHRLVGLELSSCARRSAGLRPVRTQKKRSSTRTIVNMGKPSLRVQWHDARVGVDR